MIGNTHTNEAPGDWEVNELEEFGRVFGGRDEGSRVGRHLAE